jgi:hypothetical protein
MKYAVSNDPFNIAHPSTPFRLCRPDRLCPCDFSSEILHESCSCRVTLEWRENEDLSSKAPKVQSPASADQDQRSNHATKQASKPSSRYIICHSSLPIVYCLLVTVLYTVISIQSRTQITQPRQINTDTPRSLANITLCAQFYMNRKLTFLSRCKGPHRTHRRGTMIISVPHCPRGRDRLQRSTRYKMKRRVSGTGKGVEGSARVT